MAGHSAVTARPAKPAGHIAMRGRQGEWQLARQLLRRAQRGRKLNIGSRVELARIVLEQTQQSEPG